MKMKENTKRVKLTRTTAIQALALVESRRAEVLSEMSDPFKSGPKERGEVVLELQSAHHRLYD